MLKILQHSPSSWNASTLHSQLANHLIKELSPQSLSKDISNHRKSQWLVNQKKLSVNSLRTRGGIILSDAGKQSWDLGRFLKTLFFFNGPPSPAKFFESLIGKFSSPSTSEKVGAMEVSGIVLLAGATGGVGRRVVDLLRKKRLPVRVLVRNEEKARRMLGPDVDLIVGDITRVSTLLPEYFKGVRMVINAVSVIVGPKEGDTPDRAKYSQGIKFFEPEELFRLQTMVNFSIPEDVSAYDGVELRIKGDGRSV